MNLKTAEFIVDQVENIGEEAELYEDSQSAYCMRRYFTVED